MHNFLNDTVCNQISVFALWSIELCAILAYLMEASRGCFFCIFFKGLVDWVSDRNPWFCFWLSLRWKSYHVWVFLRFPCNNFQCVLFSLTHGLSTAGLIKMCRLQPRFGLILFFQFFFRSQFIYFLNHKKWKDNHYNIVIGHDMNVCMMYISVWTVLCIYIWNHLWYDLLKQQ